MSSKKRNIIISTVLIILAILFTILVKVVDVQEIGANETSIGFATINKYVFVFTGINTIWYHITECLGYIIIFMAMVYALIGLIQLIKRKSLFKIDKEILLLGLFYIVVIALYVFFEKVIINYRPILVDGALEASYPSSHTLMTLFLCGSAIIVNKRLFNSKITNLINIALIIIMPIIILGRLISGYHWFTDIVGGILISSALLMTFYSSINLINKKDKTEENNEAEM